MKGFLILLATLLAGAGLGQCTPRAWAHDGYEHLRNPVTGASCCDDRDCKPVDVREIGESGSDYTWRGSYFPKRQSQPSPDDRWHVCSYTSWQLNGGSSQVIRCMLRPTPGA